ncbi:MAG: ABC transporter substrate-binding protein [Magnetococcales bacterium]|nr:ABC transporter substrate-binding protein [Magnetococcales bacterium]
MAAPAIARPTKNLTIGYIPILDHLLLGAAHAREQQALTGITIDPRLFKSWSSLAGALEAGVIDGAFLLSNLGMELFSRQVPVRALLVGHRNGSGLVVRADSSIAKPEDFAGKTVAIPSRVSTHAALLDHYLRRGGLSLAALQIREIAPPLMVEAMMRGSIDAFIVAEPFCAKAEEEKVGKMLVFSKDILPRHICCILVMRADVLAAHPEGMQSWVDALLRTGLWLDQQKGGAKVGEVAQLASRYMPHPESILLAALQHPSDRIIYKDLRPLPDDFQALLDISQKAGLLPKVDLASFIDDRFIKAGKG